MTTQPCSVGAAQARIGISRAAENMQRITSREHVAAIAAPTDDRPIKCAVRKRRRWRRDYILICLVFVVAISPFLQIRTIWLRLQQSNARKHGEKSALHRLHQEIYGPSCLIDELLGDEPAEDNVALPRDERFIVYAPQFGLGNQQITLRNAVIWAMLLNRTLVLPHVLTHAGCSNASLCTSSSAEFAPHDVVYDLTEKSAAALKPLLRVMTTRDFLKLMEAKRLKPPTQLIVLGIRALWAYRMTDHYWGLLGLDKHLKRVPLEVPLRSFGAEGIRSAFGACGHHRVLAFRSLFAAFIGDDYPTPRALVTGKRFIDSVALPVLLKPHGSLAARADEIARTLRDNGNKRLACVHIRLGDIIEDCKKYEAESRDLRNGRPWVISHYQTGYSCFQPLPQLVANLKALQQRAAVASERSAQNATSHPPKRNGNGKRRKEPPLSIYAAIEEPSYLRQPLLQPFNISCLTDWQWHIEFGVAKRFPLPPNLPQGLHDVLLDQMVCSRADHIMLNIFSTFSQMMLTRIGLDHPNLVGWTRELGTYQQELTGVTVDFWKTLRIQSPHEEDEDDD